MCGDGFDLWLSQTKDLPGAFYRHCLCVVCACTSLSVFDYFIPMHVLPLGKGCWGIDDGFDLWPSQIKDLLGIHYRHYFGTAHACTPLPAFRY